eukprot:g9616.t1
MFKLNKYYATQARRAGTEEEVTKAMTAACWACAWFSSGYFHPDTKVLSNTHPVLDKFETFICQQRDFAKNHDPHVGTMSTEQLCAKLGVVLDGILNRYNKGLPPVTPEIVESVALYFSIPTEKEYQLALQLRSSLEGYVDMAYQRTLVTNDLVNPMGFLKRMRKEIIKRCVLEKETPILMCQECECKSATLKCKGDFWCADCFAACHATGKRKFYKTEPVYQNVCDICDQVPAVLVSMESGTRTCDGCYQKNRNKFVGHRMKYIKVGLPCNECPAFVLQTVDDPDESSFDDPEDELRYGTRTFHKDCRAEILCEDCCELFCNECFVELHRRRKRLEHVYCTINAEGQLVRQGMELPPEESSQLINKARLTAEGGYYVPFKDDQFNTYWYHFRDKIVTHQNPYL